MEASGNTPTVVNVVTSPCTHQKKDHEIVLSELYIPNNNLNPTTNYNNVSINNDDDDNNNDDQAYFDGFPPGYRFCPLDSELIVYYLRKKIMDQPLPRNQIREVNLYRHNPDYLSARYPSVGGNQWYFFTPRTKKYLNGSRPDRAAGTGYWKATGADKEICYHGNIVGFRKSLVFYQGKAPNGKKTNWIMQEYRLAERHKSKSADKMMLDDYILCKIYEKNDKSINARRRKDENPVDKQDNESVQQDELEEENYNLFDSPAINNEQGGYPLANQASYTYSSLDSVLHQVPMNSIRPPSLGAATIPGIPQQYFHQGAASVGSFMHSPYPVNVNAAQGYMNLQEGTLVSQPEAGHINMVAQDNFDSFLDIDYANPNSVDLYLDLDNF